MAKELSGFFIAGNERERIDWDLRIIVLDSRFVWLVLSVVEIIYSFMRFMVAFG